MEESYQSIEQLFERAQPPVAGSTDWYDACDLLATGIKSRLREKLRRGFQVEVYGDQVALIVRVRGDGYGVDPWSVDRCLNYREPLLLQVEDVVKDVTAHVADKYVQG